MHWVFGDPVSVGRLLIFLQHYRKVIFCVRKESTLTIRSFQFNFVGFSGGFSASTKFFWRFIWVFSIIAGLSVSCFFSIKKPVVYIFLKIRFPADVVDASRSHGWSLDAFIPSYADFSGARAVFEIFISTVGRVENWCWASVDNMEAMDGASVEMPWTTDGPRWDPMESQYGTGFILNFLQLQRYSGQRNFVLRFPFFVPYFLSILLWYLLGLH